jgi:hypothetical protein
MRHYHPDKMTDVTRETRQPGHDKSAEDAQELADIKRYIGGWQEIPITAEDVLWNERVTAQRLSDYPWVEDAAP